ncbi:MAG: HNH endonuclease signature motif containing protein [Solibacillus sp.]
MNYDFTKDSERKRFYKSSAWYGVNGARNRAVSRDNNECVWCKEEGRVTTNQTATLEVDHIKELKHCTYEEAIDLNNLRTLCSACHNMRHNRFNGKKNKWADDEKW